VVRIVTRVNWEIPTHDIVALRERSTRYCVVVFVVNEGHRLLRQLEEMRPFGSLADVVVADGGSTDGSTDPARLASLGVRALLVKLGPGGLSAQMRMAFAWALDDGYEGIVTIDGNGKDDPAGIESMLDALAAGEDHVQGSRYLPGGAGVNTPRSRYLAVRFVHAPLISLAAGRRYTDTTNGFRAYSARLLRDPRVDPFRAVFDRYQLHYYLAIRAARLGFRVAEVPVTRRYPVRGVIPTKISPIRGNFAIFSQLVQTCLGRFDPPEAGPP
jgi:glycosyltransferase involved in cell wall biosynthesis